MGVCVTETGYSVYRPPPLRTKPAGASSRFPATTLCVRVSVGGGPPKSPFQIPPPSAPDGTPNGIRPPAPVASTRLSTTRVRSTMSCPTFAMPPPCASAAPPASATTLFRATRLSRIVSGASTSIPPPSATASPAAVAWARLSVTCVRSSSSGASLSRPPPNATASVPCVTAWAEAVLADTFVSRMTAVGRATPQHWETSIPPASATRSSSNRVGGPETSAMLSLTTLPSIVSAPDAPIPPAPANWPFGSVAVARFPLTTLRLSTSVDANRLVIPPEVIPLPSVAMVELEPETLFVISESVIVRTPPLSIPQPVLNPHGSGPQNTNGG